MRYELGYFDLEEKTSQPWKTLSGQKCYLCLRNELFIVSPGWTELLWWTAWDSNPRPPRCERGALPAELAAPFYERYQTHRILAAWGAMTTSI